MGVRGTSIVTTPATSYDLTTLAALQLSLGDPASDTALVPYFTDRISRVSASIARYLNNPIVAETRTDSIYLERGAYPWQVPGGANVLQLNRWPIIEVTSVTIMPALDDPDVLVEGKDYIIDAESGQLIRLSASTGLSTCWDALPTTVVYQGGYATVPLDVEDACQRMVAKAFWSRGRDPTLMQRDQPGLGTERYWVPNGGDGNMPPEIEDLLHNYRVPVFA